MKTIFTVLFSLLSLSVFAQKNFVKGYYITTQGDTIQSYINDKNWIKNPDHIRVALSPDGGSETVLTTADVRGFGLSSGDIFVREVVELDKSAVSADRMEVGTAPIVVTDTVFLRVLVKGALNLLHVKDENAKEHYFMQQPQARPEELVIIRKLVIASGKTDVAGSSAVEAVRTVAVYKEQLARAMHACPEAAEKAYATDLKAQPLIRLFVNYNACISAEEPAYVAKSEKVRFEPGIVAGFMPTTLTISRENYDYILRPGNFTHNYTVGLSLNTVLPRANGSWSVYNELAWRAYKVEGSREQHISANYYKHETIAFDMGYLALNTAVRYQFPFQKVRPYVLAGASNSISLRHQNNVNTYSREFTIENRSDEPFLDPVRKYEFAFLGGIGVQLKQLSAEMRYERGNGMSPSHMIVSTRDSYTFLIGYTFK